MINLRSDKPFDLVFQLDIRGADETPKSRLVIETTSGINVSFPGSFDPSTEKVKVSIPKLEVLEDLLESERFNAELEVIVDGSYFTPWKDQVEIKKPVRVSAESVEFESETIKESTAEVKNSPKVVYKEDKLKNLKEKLPKKFKETLNENGVVIRTYE